MHSWCRNKVAVTVFRLASYRKGANINSVAFFLSGRQFHLQLFTVLKYHQMCLWAKCTLAAVSQGEKKRRWKKERKGEEDKQESAALHAFLQLLPPATPPPPIHTYIYTHRGKHTHTHSETLCLLSFSLSRSGSLSGSLAHGGTQTTERFFHLKTRNIPLTQNEIPPRWQMDSFWFSCWHDLKQKQVSKHKQTQATTCTGASYMTACTDTSTLAAVSFAGVKDCSYLV